tara:strand:+ start:52 stop:1128 length:1077 start_codon:yes stop_codon:yes gene_type:complete
MAYEPILGKNVTRWDEDNPTPWNNFFRNAEKVFNVPTQKVFPLDVELVTGNDNPEIDIGASNSGAMEYRGDYGPSILGIGDKALDTGNTAEHEYMHAIGNYFGNYPNDFGGSSGYVTRHNINNNKDKADYMLWSREHDPRNPVKNAREAYLENPDLYKAELASHLTGYGGPFGDYERQMMEDSWVKRGPLNQWSIDKKPKWAKDRKPLEKRNKFDGYFMNKKYYRQNDAQQNALINAFNNNPNNERLGEAKELIAPMIAQTLSDDQYRLNADYRSLNEPTRKKRLNLGYGTFDIAGYGGRKGPKYLDSIEERFARLGAQYMKSEGIHDKSRHNAINETDFRKGMSYLLNRENQGPLAP